MMNYRVTSGNMKWVIICVLSLLYSCSTSTLPVNSDLSEEEAYQFMNECYGMRLDTMLDERNIHFRSLRPGLWKWTEDDLRGIEDFEKVPFPLFHKYAWNQKKLDAYTFVDTTLIGKMFRGELSSNSEGFTEQWEQEYGRGFAVVSLPIYNESTNTLVIREHLVGNDSYCGTGNATLYYKLNDDKKWIRKY